MLDCKCVLADWMFVQMFLNYLLCEHDDLELSGDTRNLHTNVLRDKSRDFDFLPDCNVHGTLFKSFQFSLVIDWFQLKCERALSRLVENYNRGQKSL